jgi:hypothetical protein
MLFSVNLSCRDLQHHANPIDTENYLGTSLDTTSSVNRREGTDVQLQMYNREENGINQV